MEAGSKNKALRFEGSHSILLFFLNYDTLRIEEYSHVPSVHGQPFTVATARESVKGSLDGHQAHERLHSTVGPMFKRKVIK